jgi:molybdenum cofactor cytidylyltransferase
MLKYGIIILAAGSSSRLGSPKQLLRVHGITFIAHVVKQASALPNAITLVVSGAADQEIRTALQSAEVPIFFNPQWETGMAHSIKTGLEALLLTEPGIEACMLLVCDQPHLSTSLLKEMVNLYETSRAGILACSYGNTAGSPAIFERQYFEELMRLKGQEGAKKIIQKYQTNAVYLPFPNGVVDIDTAEEYVTFISRQQERTIDAGKGI